jgi:pimeloyl-ACP methyl ester carboxylesterase
LSDEYDAWLQEFSTDTVNVAGVATAVYVAPQPQVPLRVVLFVHGINGDYHGFVPVAYELREQCRVVFVDLPGHGNSSIPTDEDLVGGMKAWSKGLVEALRIHGLDVSVVAGHSFGAYIAQETNLSRLALLNPPFAASQLSRRGTVLLDRAAPMVGGVYSSYTAMVRRGHWLMHRRTEKTDAIIAWSSRLTRITREQFKFQTRFATAASLQNLMNIPLLSRVPKLLVIMSRYDRVVNNAGVPIDQLPQAQIVMLPTDHVSVTEMPERVASEIRQLL